MMPIYDRNIGFDRTIQLNWIDAAVEMLQQGLTGQEIWEALNPIIGAVLTGKDAIRKCKTVIFRIWIRVPDSEIHLRDEAMRLMKEAGNNERLALHWGMSCLAYPFFRDASKIIGKSLQMQDEIAADQVIRRLVEIYGERSTLIRAAQRLFVTMMSWGVLKKTDKKAFYTPANLAHLDLDRRIVPWISEAIMIASDRRQILVNEIEKNSIFFPFEIDLRNASALLSERFTLSREGGNMDVLLLNK